MKRALDWSPLDRSVEGRLDSRPVSIAEIGFSGCRVEHLRPLPPGFEGTLRFEWKHSPFRLEVVVLQCELLNFTADGAVYQSSLQFQHLTAGDRADLGRIVLGETP